MSIKPPRQVRRRGAAPLLLAIILLSLCTSPERQEAEQIPLEELLPQESELPPNWGVVWSVAQAGVGKITASLEYLPTGGRAWLWIYRDGNGSVFGKEMGREKARGSLIKRLTYKGVCIYRYRTEGGYNRYIAHAGGYTFIFESDVHATGGYSSGAPAHEEDELFRRVIGYALRRGVAEVGPKAGNLTISARPGEVPPLSVEYVEVQSNATPEGYRLHGILRLRNMGNRSLINLRLWLVAGNLSSNERNALRHIPGADGLRAVPGVEISPARIWVERLPPGGVEELPVEVTLHGEGDLYKLELRYQNHTIWSTFGFLTHL